MTGGLQTFELNCTSHEHGLLMALEFSKARSRESLKNPGIYWFMWVMENHKFYPKNLGPFLNPSHSREDCPIIYQPGYIQNVASCDSVL